MEGRWQSQSGAAKPLGTSRPAWKILRVLGNLLDLPAFEYESSEQIRDELKARVEAMPAAAQPQQLATPGSGIHAEPVIDIGMYEIDPVLRRAGALRRTLDGRARSPVNAGAAS
jgi:NADH-quinone oxidoreductase subunit G